MQVDERYEELARHLQPLEDGEDYVYRASREISRQEAEWLVIGAQHHNGAEVIEQGGLETGIHWTHCRKKGTDLVVLVKIKATPQLR